MSFESVYRSRQGVREINKIFNFLMSLVIKNNYEANKAATSESISDYYNYHGAYSKTDDFADYTVDDRRKYMELVYAYMSSLKNRGYTISMQTVKTLTEYSIKSLNRGLGDNKEIYKDYLLSLRFARIYLYDEKNPYYRQFLGLPNTTKDYVYITNFDVSEDGYTEVTDFSKDPVKGEIYYTKSGDEYVKIGQLSSWYDLDSGDILADNFWIFNTLPAHMLTYEDFPISYSFYIQQKNINTYIEKHPDLNYLRFIGKNFTPYFLHELPNYSIITYQNGVLSGMELEYFKKSFNKARTQVLMDYIEGFDKKQPLYNLIMIQNLLYFTIINYTNSYIERYSVDIYTEENLNDILDSHGYSNLTKISSVELKERIVRNLNDLISNKGNNFILNLILDRIIRSNNTELKRYYLEKEYSVSDEDGSIDIDTSKGLEHSVNLVLREIPVSQLDSTTKTSDVYKDYDIFVNSDDMWAGIEPDDSDIVKAKKKRVLKRELTALDFNSILTRYITLTTTVDILESQRVLRDALYLMFKYFELTDYADFFHNKIIFQSTNVTPAALFAAMCWLQQMKSYDDPDKIVTSNVVINNSAVFRQFGKLVVDRQSFENTVIYDGIPMTQYDISADITNWKVHEYIQTHPEIFEDFLKGDGVETERIETVRIKDAILQPELKTVNGKIEWVDPLVAGDGYKNMIDTKETIEDSMPIYRFYSNGVQLGDVTIDTTFGDLISDYKTEMPNLMNRLTRHIGESYDYNTYQAWLFLQDQARKDNSILYIFKEYERFSEYISDYCDSDPLIDWMEDILKSPIRFSTRYKKPAMENICNALETITNEFKRWVTNDFSNQVYKNADMTGDMSYIDDMKILFDEFLSVYSELYSVDFKYTMGDKETSEYRLALYYNPLQTRVRQELIDHIELSHQLYSRIQTHLNSEDELEDTLRVWFEYRSKELTRYQQAINNELNLDEETNEYIPDDPFEYDLFGMKIKTRLIGRLDMDYQMTRSVEKVAMSDNLNILRGVLKIKTEEGANIYHE